jgi:hypothetical protein
MSGDSGGLGCGGRLSRVGLLLHLAITLSQIENFDVSRGVDLMHGVPGRPPRLPIQVIALNEDGMIGQTSQPYVSFASQVELNA